MTMASSVDEKPTPHASHTEAIAYVSKDKEAVTENATTAAWAAGVDDFDFTPKEQWRIIRRIDRRLVLTVGAMYCVSLMDRTNLAAASIAGMLNDLQLVGNRYVGFLFLHTFDDKTDR